MNVGQKCQATLEKQSNGGVVFDGWEKGRYDAQIVTFAGLISALKIPRLSKKSPSRLLGEMQKKMTSQNAPQSTIS